MIELSLAALLSLTSTLQQEEALRVMRVHPQGTVAAAEVVTVTFDRPVAAGLDRTVDAASIFSIQPPVPGKVEWRDPVTIRFTPADPLRPAAEYTVTIADNFTAMDGSRLSGPYTFTVRIQGPTVLEGVPVGEHNQRNINRFVTPNERFDLLLSVPADEEMVGNLSRSVHVVFDERCASGGRIDLRPGEQRPVSRERDGWPLTRFVAYGPYAGELAEDLRVIELAPERPLPLDCGGELRVPVQLDRPQGPQHAWRFRTYGPLRLTTAHCDGRKYCPIGPIHLQFSTPVNGSDVLRYVTVSPGVEFAVRDTASDSPSWLLEADLDPRTSYAIVVDTALTDVFGQRIGGSRVRGFSTTGYAPMVSYSQGKWLVERQGPRSLSVEHINIDTLEAVVASIPRSMEHRFLSQGPWAWRELWDSISSGAARRKIGVGGEPDKAYVTGVRMPAHDARQAGRPTLMAVRFDSFQLDTTVAGRWWTRPIAVIQVTSLAVHARIGAEEASVWVTGADDGEPRAGAQVTLHDDEGRAVARATTDSAGLARLADFELEAGGGYSGFEGYVAAQLGEDRAIAGFGGYDPYLSPWRFGISGAWGVQRRPVAAGVFTERGIYRPGEPVYAKAIARRGNLGDLRPAAGDSLRWRFLDRDGGILKDTVVVLSEFGTADHRVDLPTDIPLGQYQVSIELRDQGSWQQFAGARYRVAEYRPPEFLVEASAGIEDGLAGDTARVDIEARYLFGAPMGRAAVSWVARERPTSVWRLPGTEGFYLGNSAIWWDDTQLDQSIRTLASVQDTLDDEGHLAISLALPEPRDGRPALTTIEATVTDINRQSAAASATVTTHPAAFYIGARPQGETYFWRAGEPQAVGLIAVDPEGERVSGVSISGTAVRREWHRVRRQRGGRYETVGEWVSDTVATCSVTSGSEPSPCSFTPEEPGGYILSFRATDDAGHEAYTSFYRWVVGEDWVPWYDENQLEMEVIADKERYEVGDTATVLFASPFTDAEAWIAVEREGLIEQRRLRIASGSTTLKFPITEAYVPNAFISILVTRGRSAPPGPPDDPGRPAIRVGYTELAVERGVKRLAVDVRPLQPEHGPGDTARFELQVQDSRGRGERAEVTLWAVDEGVLALTGYRTPDPLDLIYRRRGLGVTLTSNLVAVAEQVEIAEELKAKGEPGGGGGGEEAGVLRSQFRVTAFFLGSVVTDGGGRAIAAAKLPDNLTTFRVMAVAVTAGDRYGSGESELLVTRPLLARPALPRFVRPGDELAAGVVINHRLAGTPTVSVDAEAENIELLGTSQKSVTLAAGRGAEARFRFRAEAADSATFRFAVSGEGHADAVQTRIPVRPTGHPRGHTVAGVLWDEAVAELTLPGDIDPARSTLEINVGGSPLAFLSGARKELRVYPFYCSEQVSSSTLPLIALYRAQRSLGERLLTGDPETEIRQAVAVLTRRQRTDGGIGFWHRDGWSSPWLSAYAGRVLLEARDAGIAVSDTVLLRLADYLRNSLRERGFTPSPLVSWYRRYRWLHLTEGVAAVDFLSRLGTPEIPAENTLLREIALMRWEDKVRLAGVVARRDAGGARSILESVAWPRVIVEGRRANLPRELIQDEFYFRSQARSLATLFSATLAVDPDHPLLAPMLATLVSRGQMETRRRWTTQDFGATVLALLEYEGLSTRARARTVRIASPAGTVARAGIGGAGPFERTSDLTGLLADTPDGGKRLRLGLATEEQDGPIYYYLTVREVPIERPVRPGDAGIQVERWYERYDRPGEPIIAVEEGELVRVRLRIRVPNERHFFILDDPLPAGLEAVDVSLRTEARLQNADLTRRERDFEDPFYWGAWYYGYWSPFDHRELRDDRVVYAATVLWPGTYEASYVARATTPGTFVRPPVHAEEMYNPAVNGRSDGGEFNVGELER